MNILQEHLQKKCEAVFRRIMRTNKEIERFYDFVLTGTALLSPFSHVLPGSPRGGKSASKFCDGLSCGGLQKSKYLNREVDSGYNFCEWDAQAHLVPCIQRRLASK
ncbi:hypothetical protein BLA27_04445 [Brucella cytisi]|uniref:Uncharacterized protein n=1 Tax=Brucella cytisi TaxID=407152 RepID=A0A1J6IA35_9HYPH|nr:hypothetical protein BLA27_04445 [Brucella cytisi]